MRKNEEDSEEEPDVEEINDKEITSNNKTTCISEELSALKEVFDEELCTSLLIGWYESCSKLEVYLQIRLLHYSRTSQDMDGGLILIFGKSETTKDIMTK